MQVGEAFRALVRVGWVRLSYGVASAYVLADTNDKAGRMGSSLEKEDEGRSRKIAVAAFDTLVWQALASVIIPGLDEIAVAKATTTTVTVVTLATVSEQ